MGYFDKARNKVKSAGEKISDEFKKATGGAKGTADSLTEGVKTAGTTVSDAVKSGVGRSKRFGGNVSGDIKKGLESARQATTDATGFDPLDPLGNAQKALGGFNPLDPLGNIELLKNQLGGLGVELGGAAGGIGGTDAANKALAAALGARTAISDPTTFSARGLQGLQTVSPADIAAIQQVTLGDESQFRGDQASLIAMLQDRAAGTGGPSPAELQLKAAQDAQLNQAMALAASQSGRSSPATQRQLMQQQAMSGQQLGQQSAILRAQEMQDMLGLLGITTQQAREGDISRTGMQADIDLQTQTAEADRQKTIADLALKADLANQAQTLEAEKFTTATDLEAQGMTEAAAFEREKLLSDQETKEIEEKAELERLLLELQTKKDIAKEASDASILGAGLGGVGAVGAAAASDKRLKHNIGNVSNKDLDEFFKAMKPKSYKYNSKEHGTGDKIGFMMQDIEKTKLGKKISRKLPSGHKGYDPQALQGILLAQMAMDAKKKKGKK